MRIAGLQKLTLLDFPGKTAATVFTPGCNLRCPFCHNADLVRGEAPDAAPEDAAAQAIPVAEALAFLDKRRNLLDGVCISGGEPLLQPRLDDFCAAVRKRGFAVKLDTNGCFPERLRMLIEEGLVDYVALDMKNAPARYGETVGVPGFDAAPVAVSAATLRASGIPFELRTTVVRELHGPDNLLALARWIDGAAAGDKDAAGTRSARAASGMAQTRIEDGPARRASLAAASATPAESRAGIDAPRAKTGAEAADPAESRSADGRQRANPPWFLQSYRDAESVLAGPGRLHAWNSGDLRALLPRLQAIYPNTQLRGVD